MFSGRFEKKNENMGGGVTSHMKLLCFVRRRYVVYLKSSRIAKKGSNGFSSEKDLLLVNEWVLPST